MLKCNIKGVLETFINAVFNSLNEHVFLQFISLVFPFLNFDLQQLGIYDQVFSQKLFNISQVPVRKVQFGFIHFSHINLSQLGRFSLNQENAETLSLVQSFSLRGAWDLGFQLFSGLTDLPKIPEEKWESADFGG